MGCSSPAWLCKVPPSLGSTETNAPFRLRWCVVRPAGQTAEALGDLDRAVASYESALRHNAYSVVALSQIAAICRSKEEFKKAAEYFGRVVGIAPESGDVWGALGELYTFSSHSPILFSRLGERSSRRREMQSELNSLRFR